MRIRQRQRLAAQQDAARTGQRLDRGAVVDRGNAEDTIVDQAARQCNAARTRQPKAAVIADRRHAGIALGSAQLLVAAGDSQAALADDLAGEHVMRVRQRQRLAAEEDGARTGQRLDRGAGVGGRNIERTVVDHAARQRDAARTRQGQPAPLVDGGGAGIGIRATEDLIAPEPHPTRPADHAGEHIAGIGQRQRRATQQHAAGTRQRLDAGTAIRCGDIKNAIVHDALRRCDPARPCQRQRAVPVDCGRASISIRATQGLVTATNGQAAGAIDHAAEQVVGTAECQRLATQQHTTGAGQARQVRACVGARDIELAIDVHLHAGHVAVRTVRIRQVFGGADRDVRARDHHLCERHQREYRHQRCGHDLAHARETLALVRNGAAVAGLDRTVLALRACDFGDGHQHVAFSVPDETIDMIHVFKDKRNRRRTWAYVPRRQGRR